MICAPVYVPIADMLGFDRLWYAMLFMINMQAAYISPPFGLGLFFMKSVLPEGLTLGHIYRSIWPFVACQIALIVLVMLIPSIALWLPKTVMG